MQFNLVPHNEWIDTEQQLVDAATYCYNVAQAGGVIGFDTETTGLRIDRDLPLIFSMSDGVRRFACMFEQFGRHPWIVNGILGNRQVRKVGTNSKFDMHMLANAGVEVLGDVEDTIVLDWLWDENRWGHGLKETAKEYRGLAMKEFKEVFPMRKATRKMPAETPGEAIRRVMGDPTTRPAAQEYSGLDPFASVLVRNYLVERLATVQVCQGRSLWDHFNMWELPFTRVLFNCERRGFSICTGHLIDQMGPMEEAMAQIEAEIAERATWVVNINSPKQLRKLLFDQLGHKPIKMTDGGTKGVKEPSTDEEVLATLADNGCPVSQKIMEFRKVSKIYGTYVVGMLDWVDGGMRIHTTLNQGGTVTGRLSSRDPNLQNIPRPKGDKFKIREAFVAQMGTRLVVLDYDQLEMKIMAHFSGDARMIDAIRSGKDLHCYTVSLMYGIPYDDVIAAKKAKNPTEEQERLLMMRQSAKAVGFGLIYGIGPLKLAVQLAEELKRPFTKDEAKDLIRKYFNVFQGVEAFIKSTHKSCQRTEYVQTLIGRFRRLPQINARGGKDDDDDGKGIVAEAKRQAVNSIIQGTAADIAKAAMLQADNDHVLQSLGAKLLLQIHDELIFEIPDDDEIAEKTLARARQIMEDPFNGYQLAVPLTVGGSHGYTWAESK